MKLLNKLNGVGEQAGFVSAKVCLIMSHDGPFCLFSWQRKMSDCCAASLLCLNRYASESCLQCCTAVVCGQLQPTLALLTVKMLQQLSVHLQPEPLWKTASNNNDHFKMQQHIRRKQWRLLASLAL